MSAAFLPARAKLCIASLDKPEIQVRAQYNPKELQIDKQIQWQDHKSRNKQAQNRPSPDSPPSSKQAQNRQEESQQSDLELTSAPSRSMSIELLFDGYELGESVEPDVMALEELSSVLGPDAKKEDEAHWRAHHCIITWGASQGGMRPFRCVIESLAVKYTMWDHGGMPLRATCTIKVKEAQKMAGSKPPLKEYGETRRDPRWQRTGPAPAPNPEADNYMQEIAKKRAQQR